MICADLFYPSSQQDLGKQPGTEGKGKDEPFATKTQLEGSAQRTCPKENSRPRFTANGNRFVADRDMTSQQRENSSAGDFSALRRASTL